MNQPEEFEVHVDVQLRFRDLDAMGHVNNSVYLSFLELARMEYFKVMQAGPLAPGSFNIILARMEVDYLAPIQLSDDVRVHVGVSRLGNSSFEYRYLLASPDSGKVFARAASVQVAYDYKQGRTVPLDPAMVQRMLDIRSSKGLAPPPGKPHNPD